LARKVRTLLPSVRATQSVEMKTRSTARPARTALMQAATSDRCG